MSEITNFPSRLDKDAEPHDTDVNWDIIITSERKWWDFRIGELWHYRDLIALFVRRDLIATYKQTVLGPVWYLINPILTTVVFTFIFNNIAGLSTDETPPFLFYLAGTVVWSYFSNVMITTSNTFIGNEGIFGKVYFPRMAVPASLIFSNLAKFGIQYFLFIFFLLYFFIRRFPVQPNAWILITPLLVLLMGGFGLGTGIIISALTTKYRDLQGLVPIGAQLLMYATPVIYPTSSIPLQYRPILFLNPLAPVFEVFRFAYLGAGSVNLAHIGYSISFMVVLLLIGIALFNRIEATFVDTI